MRGQPNESILNSYRPWLFQTEHGSYQFAVSVQKTHQLKLNVFDTDISTDINPKQIIDRLLEILLACAESPINRLPEVVPNDDYGNTFLKLTRDLAPAEKGKRFTQLDIRSANTVNPIILDSNTRDTINQAIRDRKLSPPDSEDMEISGVLRAIYLDNDGIEIVSNGETKRIYGAGDEVDDRIGPMVNHHVVVRAVKKGENLHFIDIEAAE